ncbi:MAG: glycerophosphodiester phosphodiesterase [Clostridia bacterium]|nr:glycerophosphodiester phosphodiesterase [Clostridia bacterium]
MLILLAALCALAGLWLFLIWPNPGRSRAKPWLGRRFAHRGLHDRKKGLVENTLPAFEAACQAGFGIELDIQFTSDMRVVVFHDDSLTRLTGDQRLVREVPLAALQKMPLAGVASARVPTLREVLALVDGRVPLLIELKNGRANDRLCRALMEQLRGYRGEYIVESFSPLIVRWFKKNAPEVIRGQLVCSAEGYRDTVGGLGGFVLSNLLLNALGRPDFIAYDANATGFPAPRVQRALFKTPMAAWTVRTMPVAALVETRGDMCIFEQIRP